MLREGFLNSLRTLSAIVVVCAGLPATASGQDCVNGRCTIQSDANYRFDIGRARYDYPTYSREMFPEFRSLREERLRDRMSQPDWRIRSRGEGSFGYEPRAPRDEEWRRYHDDWNARWERRRPVQPASRSRFYYSDYTIDRDDYRRPLDNLRDDYRRYEELRNRFDSMPRDAEPDRSPEPLLRDRYERPTPRREVPSTEDKLTARYSNATVVRFASSLSGNQGLSLFREVSRLIDQRHLNPRSYADRTQQGIASLQRALGNSAFRAAVGLSASDSAVRSFRSQLSQMNYRSVRSRTDAEQMLSSIMQFASRSVGVRPGVVAYEFTTASIESHDQYSAFEPTAHRVSGHVDDIDMRTAMSALDEYVTGIGVEVREHRDGLEIVKVLRGGPAVQSGVQSGDVIRAIDGQSIRGMKMSSSVSLIGGRAGEQIRILIAREGRGTKTFSLVRRRFRVYSVNDVKMLDRDQGVGYLHLNKFARSSADEMEEAIQTLRSQGMKSLVVDVRGNPGGLLTTAIEISDKFLRCGRIVSTRGRLSTDNSVETASANGTWAMPLVVLADGESASASEIFAAAIQENGRGIVIGEQTYGKGTVQTHFPLSSGFGTLRLTTAMFYSPSNREMAGQGVTPDVREADEKAAIERATAAASHPRLAEMVAQHGTCRPAGSGFGNFGSAARPATDLSALLK